MGVDSTAVSFLCAAKSMGASFDNTAMIGRQSFWPDLSTLQRAFSVLGLDRNAREFLKETSYCEPFFALLGATQIAALDASKYEGAALIHDLNQPIPDTLRERFSVVFDGGTLEHIFNVTQALKNCMEMVAVGGHFIQVTTANNYMGHGFWQFSPELIYRAFAPGNGYHVEVVLLRELGPGGAWYIAPDPEQVRMRVDLCNSWPTYILTLARRVAIAEIFAQSPQQSDYVAMWKGEADAHPPHPQRSARLRRFIPISVKRAVRDLLEPLGVFEKTQGFYQPYYRRVSERDLLLGKLNWKLRPGTST